MTYTPAWNARFAKPLLNQIIAIIQRDQTAAIATVNPALSPISEFHKGPGMRTAFPWLMVVMGETRFDINSALTRSEEVRITLALETGQFDQEIAQDNAADYARVLDMVMTTATLADWVTALPIVHETVPSGVTSAPEAGSVKLVWIDSHGFSLATRPGIDVPVVRVTLALTFNLRET